MFCHSAHHHLHKVAPSGSGAADHQQPHPAGAAAGVSATVAVAAAAVAAIVVALLQPHHWIKKVKSFCLSGTRKFLVPFFM